MCATLRERGSAVGKVRLLVRGAAITASNFPPVRIQSFDGLPNGVALGRLVRSTLVRVAADPRSGIAVVADDTLRVVALP